MYLRTRCLGTCTGISFIDSTALAVCKNPAIHSHKVFAGLAARGKTSTGWFFVFKLYLIFNDRGELLTPGAVDDRRPVPGLARRLCDNMIGDKGYLSKALHTKLFRTFGVELSAPLRSNMTNMLMPLMDKILLRKRAIVEKIIDQIKNISQIEHSRHRSPVNFLVNLLCGLIAYCRQPKKPSLGLGTLLALVAKPELTLTGIEVSGERNMVRVSVSADLSILFPSVVPQVIVTQDRIAKLRALTH